MLGRNNDRCEGKSLAIYFGRTVTAWPELNMSGYKTSADYGGPKFSWLAAAVIAQVTTGLSAINSINSNRYASQWCRATQVQLDP
jgi:hypothetical protein